VVPSSAYTFRNGAEVWKNCVDQWMFGTPLSRIPDLRLSYAPGGSGDCAGGGAPHPEARLDARVVDEEVEPGIHPRRVRNVRRGTPGARCSLSIVVPPGGSLSGAPVESPLWMQMCRSRDGSSRTPCIDPRGSRRTSPPRFRRRAATLVMALAGSGLPVRGSTSLVELAEV